MQHNNTENVSLIANIISIPINYLISILCGFLIFKLSSFMIDRINKNYLKVSITFIICLSMRMLEKSLNLEIFNSLLAIMVYGFFYKKLYEKRC